MFFFCICLNSFILFVSFPFISFLKRPLNIILRDKRHKNFSNSVQFKVKSNLEKWLVYLNCYPNFTVSLIDPNILHSLMFDIKMLNMDWEPQTKSIVGIFGYIINWCTQIYLLRTSPKDQTLLMEADTEHSNIFTPKIIILESNYP